LCLPEEGHGFCNGEGEGGENMVMRVYFRLRERGGGKRTSNILRNLGREKRKKGTQFRTWWTVFRKLS